MTRALLLLALVAMTSGCATTLVGWRFFEADRSAFLDASYEGIVVSCRDGMAEVKGFERVFRVHAYRDDFSVPESLVEGGDDRLDSWRLAPIGRDPADDQERNLAASTPAAIVIGRDAGGAGYVLALESGRWRRHGEANVGAGSRSPAAPIVGALLIGPALLLDLALSPVEIVALVVFLEGHGPLP